MASWVVLRLEDGQQQTIAAFPDVPPSPHDRTRRAAYEQAWIRLVDAASGEFSAGLHARIDQAHLAAVNPHTVNVEAIREEALVRVRCALGCPERQVRFRLDHLIG